MSGCLNPFFANEVFVDVNHAPVLINMTPAPSNAALPANVGENCAPQHIFLAERLEDADFDTLSVRWTVQFLSEGNVRREKFFEDELVPLDEAVEGRFYDFKPFELSRSRVLFGGEELGFSSETELNAVILDNEPDGELLELRVSDKGFVVGTNEPVDPTGFLFISWRVKLANVDCL